jgi:hypothetical protein
MESEGQNLGDVEFTVAERYLIEMRRQYDEGLLRKEVDLQRLATFRQFGTSSEGWAKLVEMSKKESPDQQDDPPLQPFVIMIDPYFTGPDE